MRTAQVTSGDWPRLVAIEGPSGCGKSSVIPELEAELTARGLCVKAVSNNDLQRWSDLIRGLAKTPDWPLTLAYATAGARADLRESSGAEALLICDRYVLSSLVYQRFAGVSLEILRDLNFPLLVGTRTFMLAIELQELEKRRAQRRRPPTDWFKATLTAADEIKFYEDAAAQFETFNQTVTRVDASGSPAQIANALAPQISAWLIGGGS